MEVGCVTYFVEKGDTTTREHNSTLNEEEALKVVPSYILTTVHTTRQKSSSFYKLQRHLHLNLEYFKYSYMIKYTFYFDKSIII